MRKKSPIDPKLKIPLKGKDTPMHIRITAPCNVIPGTSTKLPPAAKILPSTKKVYPISTKRLFTSTKILPKASQLQYAAVKVQSEKMQRTSPNLLPKISETQSGVSYTLLPPILQLPGLKLEPSTSIEEESIGIISKASDSTLTRSKSQTSFSRKTCYQTPVVRREWRNYLNRTTDTTRLTNVRKYANARTTVDVTHLKDGGILKEILNPGVGLDTPGPTANVHVHYAAYMQDGKTFRRLCSTDENFTFTMGKGKVIKGLEIGVSTMKKYEIALFIVQPEYAYINSESSSSVPSGSVLFLQVELFDWERDASSPCALKLFSESSFYLSPNAAVSEKNENGQKILGMSISINPIPVSSNYRPLLKSPSKTSLSGTCQGEESHTSSPQKFIKVGSDYQAAVPLSLNHYGDEAPYKNEDQLVWHPSELSDEQIENFQQQAQEFCVVNQYRPMQNQTPDDEKILFSLLESNYNIDETLRNLRFNFVQPIDTVSLWSEQEFQDFEAGIKTYGKNFYAIQQHKLRARSVGELVQFYYLWKRTVRHDIFVNVNKNRKKKYCLHPGTINYLDRFLHDQETQLASQSEFSSQANGRLMLKEGSEEKSQASEFSREQANNASDLGIHPAMLTDSILQAAETATSNDYGENFPTLLCKQSLLYSLYEREADSASYLDISRAVDSEASGDCHLDS